MAGLKPKHKLFVKEYMVDLNSTQAAIRCGYSEKTARQIGSKLLTNVDIMEAIENEYKLRSQRTEITADRTLLEIARLAFNDPRKAFDANGNLLPVKKWPDEVAAAISSIKVVEQKNSDGGIDTVKEVKFWDKGKQIELAGRHLGLFNDKLNLNNNVNVEGAQDFFEKLSGAIIGVTK